jgi:1-acyl-sn-glycerol-3-phosphate acyltransferase
VDNLTLSVIALIALAMVWSARSLVLACRRANRTDWGSGWVNLLDGFNRIFCYRYHRLNLVGIRLPKTGPAIVVSNHVSGLDALLLLASTRRPLRFLIAREQYERPGLKWLLRAAGCIPVDRQRNPEQALRSALRALKAGEIVALFPHGKIHLETDPPLRLKPGAARLAQLTGSLIFPVFISGIRGQGHVIRGVLLRGHAQLRLFQPIAGEGRSTADILQELTMILDPKVSPGNGR